MHSIKCSFDENIVSWKIEQSKISISVTAVMQAIFSSQQNAVIVLAGKAQVDRVISAYELDGQLRCTITQPAQTFFIGLGPNRGRDAAVLATVYQMGWRDWWLYINTEKATVESLGEGR